MSVGFLGIQFGWGLQMANMSPIYQYLGASGNIAILAASVPSAQTGMYFGIFNFFIVLPQIVVALIFGWIITHVLGGEAVWAVFIGGVSVLLAAVLMLRVEATVDRPTEQQEQMVEQRRARHSH